MYIVVTNVDSATKQPCAEQPLQTVTAYPAVTNLVILWSNSPEGPIVIVDGAYQPAPEFYGTCDDDSSTGFPGVTEVITEAELNSRKCTELNSRINQQVVELIRYRYSIDDELGLLRTGPSEEAEAYSDYVEECRAWGREQKLLEQK